MKTHQTLILISAALFFSLGPVNAVQTFQENFNFGALDQNLTSLTAPVGGNNIHGFTVTTNADGNGILYLDSSGFGDATVTTTFNAVGDFTNRVTASLVFGSAPVDFGIKILASQGWAGVYYHGGYGQVQAAVSFPTLSTNASWQPQSQTPAFEIRRSGNSFSLGGYDQGVYHQILTATDPSFSVPVTQQLFFHNGGPNWSQGGWFDDFNVWADQFNPQPIPRLRASIAIAAFQINWPSYSNWTYQVWYSTALNPNVWTPLGSSTNGTGYMMGVLDWVAGQPQRFYQVIGTPPP